MAPLRKQLLAKCSEKRFNGFQNRDRFLIQFAILISVLASAADCAMFFLAFVAPLLCESFRKLLAAGGGAYDALP